MEGADHQDGRTVLCIDAGAGSIRVLRVRYQEGKLEADEVLRFPVNHFTEDRRSYLDLEDILSNIVTGIRKAAQLGAVDSIGIDSWGRTHGLIRPDGSLYVPVEHGRGGAPPLATQTRFRTPGEQRRVYDITGDYFKPFCNISLLARFADEGSFPDEIAHILMLPDLLAYLLTGAVRGEETALASSALIGIRERKPDGELLAMAGVPERIFPKPIRQGEPYGFLIPEFAPAGRQIPVLAVAGHDSAAAAAGIPASSDTFAYLSNGTNSAFGIVLDHPVVTGETFEKGMTTELSWPGRWRLMYNVRAGLWIVQQCAQCWIKEGKEFDYAELDRMAQEEKPFASLVDPDDPSLFLEGETLSKIQNLCGQYGQEIPERPGQFIRCIYESLALKYRQVFAGMESCTGERFGELYVTGGGAKSSLLCQLTASAVGRPVIACSSEGATLGSAIIQLIGLGAIAGEREGRRIIRESFPAARFEPQDSELWNEQARRYSALYGETGQKKAAHS